MSRYWVKDVVDNLYAIKAREQIRDLTDQGLMEFAEAIVEEDEVTSDLMCAQLMNGNVKDYLSSVIMRIYGDMAILEGFGIDLYQAWDELTPKIKKTEGQITDGDFYLDHLDFTGDLGQLNRLAQILNKKNAD